MTAECKHYQLNCLFAGKVFTLTITFANNYPFKEPEYLLTRNGDVFGLGTLSH